MSSAFRSVILGMAFFAGLSVSADARVLEEKTLNTSFEACVSQIGSYAAQLGAAPVNVVETNIMRVVKFVFADGSVIISCSKPDNKMKIIRSDS